MPQAAPTSMGYHSCDCIEEGFNIQQTGIEGDRMSASDVSSVPIVTNQSHPLFVDPILRGPDSKAAPSRTRQAPARPCSNAVPTRSEHGLITKGSRSGNRTVTTGLTLFRP